MSVGTATPARRPDGSIHTHAVTAFIDIGWTPEQWNDLYRFFAKSDKHVPGGLAVVSWLRHPPTEFVTSITAAMVQEMFDRHGRWTAPVLGAISAGASERFAVAYLRHVSHNSEFWSAVDSWQHACKIGLTEAQATGWVMTGSLGARRNKPSKRRALIQAQSDWEISLDQWITRFGPTAYLFILAGITRAEAAAMQDAGTSPTEEQLRVMVALNGHTLPAGI